MGRSKKLRYMFNSVLGTKNYFYDQNYEFIIQWI